MIDVIKETLDKIYESIAKTVCEVLDLPPKELKKLLDDPDNYEANEEWKRHHVKEVEK